MGKEKKKTTVVAVEKKEETHLAEVSAGGMMDFLDQNTSINKGGGSGIAILKTKQFTVKDANGKEESHLSLEWNQGELKKELTEPLRGRIIFSTKNYQFSVKTPDSFSVARSTSESFPGRKDVIHFDHEKKLRWNLEKQEDFRDMYPKDQLLKTQSIYNYTIVYMDIEKYGLCKLYLKPSQYAGAFIEKTGYRYDNPLKDSFRDIEKRYPVRRYNYTFEIKAESYEKNGFLVVYPTFVNVENSDIDNEYLEPMAKGIMETILTSEKKLVEKEGRDKKFVG